MDSPIFKAAELTTPEADPYVFEAIASTPTRDRYGDVVVQDWDLREYRKNSVMLFQHDPKEIIGEAETVEVRQKKLFTRFRLYAEGTSPTVDFMRRLAEQKALRALSVGFIPGKYDPIRGDDGGVSGFRFSENKLLEISIVSIPANPDALITARSAGLSEEFTRRIISGADPAQFLSRRRAIVQQLRAKAR